MPDTFPSLFYGYLVIWGLIIVYIVYLGQRISRCEKLIAEIVANGAKQ